MTEDDGVDPLEADRVAELPEVDLPEGVVEEVTVDQDWALAEVEKG